MNYVFDSPLPPHLYTEVRACNPTYTWPKQEQTRVAAYTDDAVHTLGYFDTLPEALKHAHDARATSRAARRMLSLPHPLLNP